MNLIKQRDYFDPLNEIKYPIHIIGIGAIGSTIATMLARMGIQKLHIYDFDKVEEKNVCNQQYFADQVGLTKIKALENTLIKINPNLELIKHPEGYTENDTLSGYIFLCVDSIDLRRKIVEDNRYNTSIQGIFDFRMRLTDAQHYACNKQNIDYLLSTMQFTHEEAQAETPVSACGSSLNVITTVNTICSLGLQNFINMLLLNKYKKLILIDLKESLIDFIE